MMFCLLDDEIKPMAGNMQRVNIRDNLVLVFGPSRI